MFQPYLEYGILLWGSASRSSLKTIEIMQKKALRVITNSTYNAHTDPIFKAQQIIKLPDLHELHVNKFMYQYYIANLPGSLNNLFIQNRNIHSHMKHDKKTIHIFTKGEQY